MSRLLITLLGSMQVQLDEKPITLAYDKVRALLAYLALESERPLRRDFLTGLLWPEQPDKEARHNLSQALLKLRHAIDPDGNLLLTNRQTVQLNPSATVEIDAVVFETHLAQCQSHTHVRQETCAHCMNCRKTAVTVYHGNFLSGLSITGTREFDEWLTLWQERLHRQVIEALDALARYHERRGEYTLAIAYARQQVTHEPWREEAHRQLMRLLLFDGQRSTALAQYHACVQSLTRELNAAPSRKTEDLFNQIRTAKTQTPHNLPPQSTPFLGRQEEIAQISSFLANPDSRVLTIVGPGGMGKTRLALTVAERQLSHYTFPHGIFFISLAGIETAVTLVPTIANALEFPLAASDSSKRSNEQQLCDYLQKKRLLLILDNFEQLLANGEAEATTAVLILILQHAPDVQLLVTSRARLQLSEEQVFWLRGLDYPQGDAASSDSYTSSALFKQVAQRIQPNMIWTQEQETAVSEICRLLLGMPLAIELAATSVNMMSASDIALKLKQGLDILTTSTRTVPSRHRSMRAAFMVSWQQLDGEEQKAFAQLSLFRGGCTREAAQTITNVSLTTLSSLANQSLIHFNPAQQRIEIHELLRQFGVEMLAHDPELEKKARNQHSTFYITYLQQKEEEFKGAIQQDALNQMDLDIENCNIAWRWAIKCKNIDNLYSGLDSLLIYLEWRGRFLEGAKTCQNTVEEIKNIATAKAYLTQSRLYSWLGHFLASMGQITEGQSLIEKGEALLIDTCLTSVDTRAEKALILHHKSLIAYQSNREKACQFAEESLILYEELNDAWAKANAYTLLGRATRKLGLFEDSRRYLNKSLQIRLKLGTRRDIAKSYSQLSLVITDQDRLKEIVEFNRKEISVAVQKNDRLRMAHSNNSVGAISMFLGDYEVAEPYFIKANSIFESLGITARVLTTHIWLGISYLHRGLYEKAIEIGLKYLHEFELIEHSQGLAHTNMLLGWATLATGHFSDSKIYLRNSITIYQQLGQKKELAQCFGSYAQAHCEENRLAITRKYCQKSLETSAKMKSIFPLCISITAIVHLKITEEAIEQAVELYALLMQQPIVSQSQWFEDILGCHIKNVSQTISPERIKFLRERGGQLDLWKTADELLTTLAM